MNARNVLACLMVCLFGLSLSARAQSTKPASTGEFDVQEWAIFIADPNIPRANAISLFKSSLPEDANSRRATDEDTDQKSPCPVGVIRFVGQPQNVDKSLVDVLMTLSGGDFLGNWPKGKKQPNRLLWDNISITTEDAGLFPIGEKHWFRQLRSADSFYLKKDRGAERFLLYDVEFNFQVPIKVNAAADAGVDLVNIGSTDLHDVTVYKPQGEAWRVGSIDEIKGAEGAKKPPAAPAKAGPASRPTTEAAFASVAATKPSATTKAAATSRSSDGASKPSPTTSVSAQIPLAQEPAKSASEAVAAWKEKLSAAGLASTDFDVITSILAKYATRSQASDRRLSSGPGGDGPHPAARDCPATEENHSRRPDDRSKHRSRHCAGNRSAGRTTRR